MSLKRYALGLAAVGLTSIAVAQPPVNLALPGAPGAFPPMGAPLPGPGPVGIAPRPAMPTQNTLWSYLGVSADQREYRQRANADTRLGELRQRLLPNPRLKTPSLAELQAPGAVGAAAQVKLDRANAEKRIEAVQYLGSVDCHVWPEAEEALIGALRGDRNECVRLAAANVLLNGCCCTKKVIKALTEAANGTDCDGFPAEKSCRVRAAAQAALEKCLTCFCDMESKCPDKNCDKKPAPLPELAPLPKPGGEKNDDPKKPGEKASNESFYERAAKLPSAEVIADARKALAIAIPLDLEGGAINQADLIAAGDPSPYDAGSRSPKPNSLVGFFTSKPEPVSNVVERPLVATRPAPVQQPIAKSTPKPAAPIVINAAPMPTKQPVVSNTVPPVKPVSAVNPTPASITTTVNSSPISANVPAASKSAPTVAGPVSMPKLPTPVHAAPVKENRAEKVTKMMKGLVPVSELTTGINELTAEDLKSHPALVGELIAAGSRSTSVPVRLSTVQALVRCQVRTPEAMSVLQTAAQTDPDVGVRTAALGGLKK